MVYEDLLLEKNNGIATITLNVPEKLNAITDKMGMNLHLAADEIAKDDKVGVVIVTGAGRAFCSGADIGTIEAFLQADDKPPSALFQYFVRHLHAIVVEIRRMPKPVVAAVNGVAAGGGFSLALACDLIIASETARFTLAYSRLGVTPDGGATFFLPRLLGPAKTAELIYLDPVLTVQQALKWGFVNKVVAEDDLREQALAVAQKLAEGPSRAHAGAKDLMNRTWHHTLEAQLEEERQHIMAASMTEDFNEGVAAFQAKRPPLFKGQ